MGTARSTLPSYNLEDLLKSPSESIQSTKRRWEFLGPPGSGKTHALKTIPAGQTLLYFDYDGKAGMLRKDPDLQDTMKVVDLQWTEDDWQVNGKVKARERMLKVESVLNTLADSDQKFDWLCHDSLTNFFPLAECKGKMIAGGDWFSKNWDNMTAEDDWFWSMMNLSSRICTNIVLISHEDFRQGDTGRGYKVVPLARKALSEQMGGRFQENYRAFTRGDGDNLENCFQTRTGDLWECSTGYENLPFVVPNNLGLITETDWTKYNGDLAKAIKDYESKSGRTITRFKP